MYHVGATGRLDRETLTMSCECGANRIEGNTAMTAPTPARRLTKTERIAQDALIKNLIHLQRDTWVTTALREEVPDAWHTLECDLDVWEKKQKVTLYLETSVAKFYRAMGPGYQARINRLLATYAQMKIAGEARVDEFLEKRVAGEE